MSEVLFGACDPGKDGGLSIVNSGGKLVDMTVMPTIGKSYDLQGILTFIKHYMPSHFVIEDVHAFQGGGATSNFQFGMGCGYIEMCVAALEIPYTKISPAAWQKTIWQGVTRQKNTKDTSLIAAKRLFPNQTFLATDRSRKPHDGLVDATLLAEMARRLYFKQNYTQE